MGIDARSGERAGVAEPGLLADSPEGRKKERSMALAL
jgi:hypothetical protein